MITAIYWFRNDLRLLDNPSFNQACRNTNFLLPIFINQNKAHDETPISQPKSSKLRKDFLEESLRDLRTQLKKLNSNLFELEGDFLQVFQDLQLQLDTRIIYCEEIQAEEELEQLDRLRDAGFEIRSLWQSSMIEPNSLPFDLADMPGVFTQFRLQVEKHKIKFTPPIDSPAAIPPLPLITGIKNESSPLQVVIKDKLFYGGESKALYHIGQYFDRRLADTYKKTRNGLIGMDYSSKFSPWLALGCCSARTIANKLTEYEYEFGSNDGTYWIWFELLWRDYFRFLSFKTENQIHNKKNDSEEVSDAKTNNYLTEFNGIKFKRWSTGYTGDSFIDAGMRELISTGYLSNRMRQVVASYWIYNLSGDWRVGAAWFKAQLIDYDVYSNQGNWQYISGKGLDHQGGRQFNIAKQTQDHDPNGIYRKLWLT